MFKLLSNWMRNEFFGGDCFGLLLYKEIFEEVKSFS